MYTVYFNQATLIHHRAVWRPSSPPITLVGRLSTKCSNLQKLVKTSLPYITAPRRRKLQKLSSSALMFGSCVIIPHIVLTPASNVWRSKSRNSNFCEIDFKMLSTVFWCHEWMSGPELLLLFPKWAKLLGSFNWYHQLSLEAPALSQVREQSRIMEESGWS